MKESKQSGAGCGCNGQVPNIRRMSGGGLPVMTGTCTGMCGGSRRRACPGAAAKGKVAATLRRWKRGKKIGFTATSSLKARGLIPRTGAKTRGKCVVSNKYK